MLFLQRHNRDCAMTPHAIEFPYIQFNGNSGYARHGDMVSLSAERIDNLNSAGITSGNLALQLWACQAPYSGGNLAGWKLAEFPLGALQANHFLAPVKSDVPANLPESGDYAIALVIAEWDGEGFNRIHDFHNYPKRDVFLHPRFDGLTGYRSVDGGRIAVDVERIHNPRDPDNMSGTLSLELWALPEPYVRGDFAGHALAAVTLGSLAGGSTWQNCAYELEISPPPAGSYTLVLMLREWVGNGYVTRDHSSLQHRMTFPLVASASQASEPVIADAALGQFANTAQSPQQAGEPSVAARAAGAGPPPPKDAQQTHAAQRREDVSALAILDNLKNLKRFAERLLNKIKQEFSL
jgi:hypothetical protein